MALAALIAAYQDGPEGKLRATLPLAGRSLLERQARLVSALGASPVIVLVERLPPDLVGAIDRLRAEGVSVRVARTVGEAADAVAPDDPLLLVADGLVADPAHLSRIAAAHVPALLTIADGAADDRFERIDAASRWAGLALVDGALLRRTAAMLGDWDLQSTLLRQAIQSDARQIALRDGARDAPITIATHEADLIAIERAIVAKAHGPRGGWASRYLLAPVERLLTGLLTPTRVTPDWLRFGEAAFIALAAFLFARGWLWPGALLMLAATPLDGVADRLAALRMQARRAPGWWAPVTPVLAAAALIVLGYALSATHGWGAALLATVTALVMGALSVEARDVPRDWLAERKGMTLLMIPFAATGSWLGGIGALALYAAGSFFWAQRQAHGARPEPQD